MSEEGKETIFETSDLSLAAWMCMNEVNLLSHKPRGDGQNDFFFDDSEDQCQSLETSFVNSEVQEFDYKVKELKDFSHGPGARIKKCGDRVFKTDNVNLAAWLCMRGMNLVKYSSNGYGQVDFFFDDSQGKCDPLRMEFSRSDAQRFSFKVKALKKLSFGSRANRRYKNRKST